MSLGTSGHIYRSVYNRRHTQSRILSLRSKSGLPAKSNPGGRKERSKSLPYNGNAVSPGCTGLYYITECRKQSLLSQTVRVKRKYVWVETVVEEKGKNGNNKSNERRPNHKTRNNLTRRNTVAEMVTSSTEAGTTSGRDNVTTSRSADSTASSTDTKSVRRKKKRKRSREKGGGGSLLRAARSGNVEKLTNLLDEDNVDISTSNSSGLTAMHLAAKEGHCSIINELLQRGAPINQTTKRGNTALHIASLAGKLAIVELLITKGADANSQAQNAFTPLYMAAQEGHEAIVEYLLDHGANQSISTEDGFTPLAVALQENKDKVVQLLLDNDVKGRVKLPALHIAARKDDVKAAVLLLQNDNTADTTSRMMVNRTTESGFTALHIAAHYGNVNVATLLLNRGASVDFKARNGITPMHVAAKRGNTRFCALLLDRNGKPDACTRDGLIPIHCAARSGHLPIVKLFLDCENTPKYAKTKNGLTPLHMAAQGGHADVIEILLDKEYPVDDVTSDYLSALHIASHCGHVAVAQLVLKHNAHVDCKALNGFTPLHVACKKNRVKVVELLLSYNANIEAVTESGLSPLHIACFMGHEEIVQILIKRKAKLNTVNVRGETALHMATRSGKTEIVTYLLRHGAKPDTRKQESQTCLHLAARLDKIEILRLLIKNGATVDSTMEDGCTPLHVAAREGHVDVCETLLAHKASVAMTTKKGFTPLHLAAKYGRLEVANLLMRNEADPNAGGKNGLTPLHVASHFDNQQVALLLLKNGASPHASGKNGYTPLHIAAKKNQMEIALTLLEYGASPNSQTRMDVTPLHLAAQEGHVDMCSLLLAKDANVNAAAKHGLSPMHLAAQEDRVSVAKILYDNKSLVDPLTKSGCTPLHVASHHGNIKVANYLLSLDAKVNAKTKNGYTPLHQASQQGHTHVVNLLIKFGASPNELTNSGNTALSLAKRLGYISVVDTLKTITTETTTTVTEEKKKLNIPETVNEGFMSEASDDEGDESMVGGGFLTNNEMKELGDDSIVPTEASLFAVQQDSKYSTLEALAGYGARRPSWSSSATNESDNIKSPRSPRCNGFLVSFMVDARGGKVRGTRHYDLRIVVPPKACRAPTRVTCRFARRRHTAAITATNNPSLFDAEGNAARVLEVGPRGASFLDQQHNPARFPPFTEGEGLAARVIQFGPKACRFLGPVAIEIPHFASLKNNNRQIVVMRSNDGSNWKEHKWPCTDQQFCKQNIDEDLQPAEKLAERRIFRIITSDLPRFFALVSRPLEDAKSIGSSGGELTSSVVKDARAKFPEGSLTKKINVAMQVMPITPEMCKRAVGGKAKASIILTIEPRRRKFHKPIQLTVPLPEGTDKKDYLSTVEDSTLRLLCSISGEDNPAQWEDITGSTPLNFLDNFVTFTSTVSARFWLIDCRQPSESSTLAHQIYAEATRVPYMAKFLVFGKSHDPLEARLRVFCLTEDKYEKTLEKQENYVEIARSKDVEVCEGSKICIECSGNLSAPIKSGQVHNFQFTAFNENRIQILAKVRDSIQEPCGRLTFTRQPLGPPKSHGARKTLCNLNVRLPPCDRDSDSEDDVCMQYEKSVSQTPEEEASEARKRYFLVDPASVDASAPDESSPEEIARDMGDVINKLNQVQIILQPHAEAQASATKHSGVEIVEDIDVGVEETAQVVTEVRNRLVEMKQLLESEEVKSDSYFDLYSVEPARVESGENSGHVGERLDRTSHVFERNVEHAETSELSELHGRAYRGATAVEEINANFEVLAQTIDADMQNRGQDVLSVKFEEKLETAQDTIRVASTDVTPCLEPSITLSPESLTQSSDTFIDHEQEQEGLIDYLEADLNENFAPLPKPRSSRPATVCETVVVDEVKNTGIAQTLRDIESNEELCMLLADDLESQSNSSNTVITNAVRSQPVVEDKVFLVVRKTESQPELLQVSSMKRSLSASSDQMKMVRFHESVTVIHADKSYDLCSLNRERSSDSEEDESEISDTDSASFSPQSSDAEDSVVSEDQEHPKTLQERITAYRAASSELQRELERFRRNNPRYSDQRAYLPPKTTPPEPSSSIDASARSAPEAPLMNDAGGESSSEDEDEISPVILEETHTVKELLKTWEQKPLMNMSPIRRTSSTEEPKTSSDPDGAQMLSRYPQVEIEVAQPSTISELSESCDSIQLLVDEEWVPELVVDAESAQQEILVKEQHSGDEETAEIRSVRDHAQEEDKTVEVMLQDLEHVEESTTVCEDRQFIAGEYEVSVAENVEVSPSFVKGTGVSLDHVSSGKSDLEIEECKTFGYSSEATARDTSELVLGGTGSQVTETNTFNFETSAITPENRDSDEVVVARIQPETFLASSTQLHTESNKLETKDTGDVRDHPISAQVTSDPTNTTENVAIGVNTNTEQKNIASIDVTTDQSYEQQQPDTKHEPDEDNINIFHAEAIFEEIGSDIYQEYTRSKDQSANSKHSFIAKESVSSSVGDDTSRNFDSFTTVSHVSNDSTPATDQVVTDEITHYTADSQLVQESEEIIANMTKRDQETRDVYDAALQKASSIEEDVIHDDKTLVQTSEDKMSLSSNQYVVVDGNASSQSSNVTVIVSRCTEDRLDEIARGEYRSYEQPEPADVVTFSANDKQIAENTIVEHEDETRETQEHPEEAVDNELETRPKEQVSDVVVVEHTEETAKDVDGLCRSPDMFGMKDADGEKKSIFKCQDSLEDTDVHQEERIDTDADADSLDRSGFNTPVRDTTQLTEESTTFVLKESDHIIRNVSDDEDSLERPATSDINIVDENFIDQVVSNAVSCGVVAPAYEPTNMKDSAVVDSRGESHDVNGEEFVNRLQAAEERLTTGGESEDLGSVKTQLDSEAETKTDYKTQHVIAQNFAKHEESVFCSSKTELDDSVSVLMPIPDGRVFAVEERQTEVTDSYKPYDTTLPTEEYKTTKTNTESYSIDDVSDKKTTCVEIFEPTTPQDVDYPESIREEFNTLYDVASYDPSTTNSVIHEKTSSEGQGVVGLTEQSFGKPPDTNENELDAQLEGSNERETNCTRDTSGVGDDLISHQVTSEPTGEIHTAETVAIVVNTNTEQTNAGSTNAKTDEEIVKCYVVDDSLVSTEQENLVSRQVEADDVHIQKEAFLKCLDEAADESSNTTAVTISSDKPDSKDVEVVDVGLGETQGNAALRQSSTRDLTGAEENTVPELERPEQKHYFADVFETQSSKAVKENGQMDVDIKQREFPQRPSEDKTKLRQMSDYVHESARVIDSQVVSSKPESDETFSVIIVTKGEAMTTETIIIENQKLVDDLESGSPQDVECEQEIIDVSSEDSATEETSAHQAENVPRATGDRLPDELKSSEDVARKYENLIWEEADLALHDQVELEDSKETLGDVSFSVDEKYQDHLEDSGVSNVLIYEENELFSEVSEDESVENISNIGVTVEHLAGENLQGYAKGTLSDDNAIDAKQTSAIDVESSAGQESVQNKTESNEAEATDQVACRQPETDEFSLDQSKVEMHEEASVVDSQQMFSTEFESAKTYSVINITKDDNNAFLEQEEQGESLAQTNFETVESEKLANDFGVVAPECTHGNSVQTSEAQVVDVSLTDSIIEKTPAQEGETGSQVTGYGRQSDEEGEANVSMDHISEEDLAVQQEVRPKESNDYRLEIGTTVADESLPVGENLEHVEDSAVSNVKLYDEVELLSEVLGDESVDNIPKIGATAEHLAKVSAQGDVKGTLSDADTIDAKQISAIDMKSSESIHTETDLNEVDVTDQVACHQPELTDETSLEHLKVEMHEAVGVVDSQQMFSSEFESAITASGFIGTKDDTNAFSEQEQQRESLAQTNFKTAESEELVDDFALTGPECTPEVQVVDVSLKELTIEETHAQEGETDPQVTDGGRQLDECISLEGGVKTSMDETTKHKDIREESNEYKLEIAETTGVNSLPVGETVEQLEDSRVANIILYEENELYCEVSDDEFAENVSKMTAHHAREDLNGDFKGSSSDGIPSLPEQSSTTHTESAEAQESFPTETDVHEAEDTDEVVEKLFEMEKFQDESTPRTVEYLPGVPTTFTDTETDLIVHDLKYHDTPTVDPSKHVTVASLEASDFNSESRIEQNSSPLNETDISPQQTEVELCQYVAPMQTTSKLGYSSDEKLIVDSSATEGQEDIILSRKDKQNAQLYTSEPYQRETLTEQTINEDRTQQQNNEESVRNDDTSVAVTTVEGNLVDVGCSDQTVTQICDIPGESEDIPTVIKEEFRMEEKEESLDDSFVGSSQGNETQFKVVRSSDVKTTEIVENAVSSAGLEDSLYKPYSNDIILTENVETIVETQEQITLEFNLEEESCYGATSGDETINEQQFVNDEMNTNATEEQSYVQKARDDVTSDDNYVQKARGDVTNLHVTRGEIDLVDFGNEEQIVLQVRAEHQEFHISGMEQSCESAHKRFEDEDCRCSIDDVAAQTKQDGWSQDESETEADATPFDADLLHTSGEKEDFILPEVQTHKEPMDEFSVKEVLVHKESTESLEYISSSIQPNTSETDFVSSTKVDGLRQGQVEMKEIRSSAELETDSSAEDVVPTLRREPNQVHVDVGYLHRRESVKHGLTSLEQTQMSFDSVAQQQQSVGSALKRLSSVSSGSFVDSEDEEAETKMATVLLEADEDVGASSFTAILEYSSQLSGEIVDCTFRSPEIESQTEVRRISCDRDIPGQESTSILVAEDTQVVLGDSQVEFNASTEQVQGKENGTIDDGLEPDDVIKREVVTVETDLKNVKDELSVMVFTDECTIADPPSVSEIETAKTPRNTPEDRNEIDSFVTSKENPFAQEEHESLITQDDDPDYISCMYVTDSIQHDSSVGGADSLAKELADAYYDEIVELENRNLAQEYDDVPRDDVMRRDIPDSEFVLNSEHANEVDFDETNDAWNQNEAETSVDDVTTFDVTRQNENLEFGLTSDFIHQDIEEPAEHNIEENIASLVDMEYSSVLKEAEIEAEAIERAMLSPSIGELHHAPGSSCDDLTLPANAEGGGILSFSMSHSSEFKQKDSPGTDLRESDVTIQTFKVVESSKDSNSANGKTTLDSIILTEESSLFREFSDVPNPSAPEIHVSFHHDPVMVVKTSDSGLVDFKQAEMIDLDDVEKESDSCKASSESLDSDSERSSEASEIYDSKITCSKIVASESTEPLVLSDVIQEHVGDAGYLEAHSVHAASSLTLPAVCQSISTQEFSTFVEERASGSPEECVEADVSEKNTDVADHPMEHWQEERVVETHAALMRVISQPLEVKTDVDYSLSDNETDAYAQWSQTHLSTTSNIQDLHERPKSPLPIRDESLDLHKERRSDAETFSSMDVGLPSLRLSVEDDLSSLHVDSAGDTSANDEFSYRNYPGGIRSFDSTATSQQFNSSEFFMSEEMSSTTKLYVDREDFVDPSMKEEVEEDQQDPSSIFTAHGEMTYMEASTSSKSPNTSYMSMTSPTGEVGSSSYCVRDDEFLTSVALEDVLLPSNLGRQPVDEDVRIAMVEEVEESEALMTFAEKFSRFKESIEGGSSHTESEERIEVRIPEQEQGSEYIEIMDTKQARAEALRLEDLSYMAVAYRDAAKQPVCEEGNQFSDSSRSSDRSPDSESSENIEMDSVDTNQCRFVYEQDDDEDRPLLREDTFSDDGDEGQGLLKQDSQETYEEFKATKETPRLLHSTPKTSRIPVAKRSPIASETKPTPATRKSGIPTAKQSARLSQSLPSKGRQQHISRKTAESRKTLRKETTSIMRSTSASKLPVHKPSGFVTKSSHVGKQIKTEVPLSPGSTISTASRSSSGSSFSSFRFRKSGDSSPTQEGSIFRNEAFTSRTLSSDKYIALRQGVFTYKMSPAEEKEKRKKKRERATTASSTDSSPLTASEELDRNTGIPRPRRLLHQSSAPYACEPTEQVKQNEADHFLADSLGLGGVLTTRGGSGAHSLVSESTRTVFSLSTSSVITSSCVEAVSTSDDDKPLQSEEAKRFSNFERALAELQGGDNNHTSAQHFSRNETVTTSFSSSNVIIDDAYGDDASDSSTVLSPGLTISSCRSVIREVEEEADTLSITPDLESSPTQENAPLPEDLIGELPDSLDASTSLSDPPSCIKPADDLFHQTDITFCDSASDITHHDKSLTNDEPRRSDVTPSKSSPEVLEQKHREVASQLGIQWPALAGALGLGPDDVWRVQRDADGSTPGDQSKMMLSLWLSKQTEDEKEDADSCLSDALRKIGRDDLCPILDDPVFHYGVIDPSMNVDKDDQDTSAFQALSHELGSPFTAHGHVSSPYPFPAPSKLAMDSSTPTSALKARNETLTDGDTSLIVAPPSAADEDDDVDKPHFHYVVDDTDEVDASAQQVEKARESPSESSDSDEEGKTPARDVPESKDEEADKVESGHDSDDEVESKEKLEREIAPQSGDNSSENGNDRDVTDEAWEVLEVPDKNEDPEEDNEIANDVGSTRSRSSSDSSSSGNSAKDFEPAQNVEEQQESKQEEDGVSRHSESSSSSEDENDPDVGTEQKKPDGDENKDEEQEEPKVNGNNEHVDETEPEPEIDYSQYEEEYGVTTTTIIRTIIVETQDPSEFKLPPPKVEVDGSGDHVIEVSREVKRKVVDQSSSDSD